MRTRTHTPTQTPMLTPTPGRVVYLLPQLRWGEVKMILLQWLEDEYLISPNKCSCLNKCAPSFWLSLPISKPLYIQSHSNFLDLKTQYSKVHVVNSTHIRQGLWFILCLHTWHVSSAKHNVGKFQIQIGLSWTTYLGFFFSEILHPWKAANQGFGQAPVSQDG